METTASATPSSETPPAAAPPARPWWAAGRGWWLTGALALLVLAPLLWNWVTRPVVRPGAGVAVSSGGPAKGVGPQVDYEAPNFKLKDPSGKAIELKQFRGKAVLLNFWATWCAPCREEMPEMEQAYRQYKDTSSLVVLAVSIDDESSARHVPEYLKEGSPQVGSYTFPVALDTKQEVAKLYKLTGVPSSFFIDGAGVVRAVQPGAMSRQTLSERLRTILLLPA